MYFLIFQVTEDGKLSDSDMYWGDQTLKYDLGEEVSLKYVYTHTYTHTQIYVVCVPFFPLWADVYVAEMMLESNNTVASQTVLSALKSITDLQVTDSNGVSHIITLVLSELVAGTATPHFVENLVL